MPRFLAPITVAQEFVTGNETISGSETILGATSGRESYWTTVSVQSGLSADYGSFVHNVSATAFYGDGSHLTGINATGTGVLSTGNLSSYDFFGDGSTVLFDLSSTIPQTNAAGYQVVLNGATQIPNKDYSIVYSSGTNKLSTLFIPPLGCELAVTYLGSHIPSVTIIDSGVGSLSTNWQNTYTVTNANSSNWSNWSTVSGSYVTTTYLSTNNVKLGGATVYGTISSSGLINQAKNHCIIALTATQTIPAASDSVISFSPKDDPNSWCVVANKSIKPNVAGYYNAIVMVSWQPVVGSTEQINIQIRKNNNTVAITQDACPTTTNRNLTQLAQAIIYLNGSTDEITVTAYSGSGQGVYGEINGTWTKLELFKIS